MDTIIETLYIFLSEGEDLVSKDVERLISKKLFTLQEISFGNSLLVCISRDYLNLPNDTPAIMIRDQLCNVFCPEWRINSVRYDALSPIMYLEGDKIPEIRVITSNKDIYDNMDYYLHLSNFEKRNKLYLPDVTKKSIEYTPIKSMIKQPQIRDLGVMSLELMKMAGYDKDINGPLPGWVFQVSNDWLTRLLDLYEITPYIKMPYPRQTNLIMTRQKFKDYLLNPIIVDGPRIGEDLRACIIDSFEVRKTIMEYTEKLLKFTE